MRLKPKFNKTHTSQCGVHIVLPGNNTIRIASVQFRNPLLGIEKRHTKKPGTLSSGIMWWERIQSSSNMRVKAICLKSHMADRQGFEPWRRLPAYTRSRRAPSTTRPPVLSFITRTKISPRRGSSAFFPAL